MEQKVKRLHLNPSDYIKIYQGKEEDSIISLEGLKNNMKSDKSESDCQSYRLGGKRH